jgi:hypothetical protein
MLTRRMMRRNYASRVFAAVAFSVPMIATSALAVDQISMSVVGTPATLTIDGTPVNDGTFTLLKHGKIKVKADNKGDGTLLTMQLAVGHISCTGDDPGKCGTTTPADAVLDISARQYITVSIPPITSQDLMHVAGVLLHVVKGKAIFDATGTTKAVAGDFLGSVANTIALFLPQVLAIHAPSFRTLGSGGYDLNTNCAPPLTPGNTCLDGSEWAVGGMEIVPLAP